MLLRVVPAVLVWLCATGLLMVPSSDRTEAAPTQEEAGLIEQAREVSDLSWVVGYREARAWLGVATLQRSALVREKLRQEHDGDAAGVARINAVLAGEAFNRSSTVLGRWLPRIDASTGLLPTSTSADGQVWSYGDTGSDLFPHLAIAARLLAPSRYPDLLGVLEAERRTSPGLPHDVALPGGAPIAQTVDERIFGAAEYAKDGLLPMLERLGPDPWLGRLSEVADAVLTASNTETRGRGLLLADSTEVNGDMLQVLARLYWVTRDPRF